MSRLGTVLLMLLMTWPMVRDCCLPVTHALPCHESQPEPTDDTTCFSTQEASAATKTVTCKVRRIVMPTADAAGVSREGAPHYLPGSPHQLSDATHHSA